MKNKYFLKILCLMSNYLITGLMVILFCLFDQLFAQDSYYYHTIHSHGLTTNLGRTVKLNYLYQLGHARQLKLSGTYVYDNYEQGRNEVYANIYNTSIQMQWNVFNNDKFFCNLAAGGGGYYLQAKDRLAIKFHEWRFSLMSGINLEYFVKRNTMALTLNYDFIFMPWSKIYDYLHVPTAGVTFFFF